MSRWIGTGYKQVVIVDGNVSLVDGSTISITGNSKVNTPGFESSQSVTRPANTTAYAALDVVGENPAKNIEFENIGEIAGGHVYLAGASLLIPIDAVQSGMSVFKLHLFDAAPTTIADNVAFNLIAADRAKYKGFIALSTPEDLGDTLWVRSDNINMKIKLSSNSLSLYGVLQTVGAHTPASGTIYTATLYGVQC